MDKNPRKALLIIDIQEDYTGTTAKPPFPYKNSEKLIKTVNKLIEEAAERNMVIVYIRQEFESFWGKAFSRVICGGTAIKGNPGTEFDQRITVKSDYLFTKPKADGFSNPKLEEFLKEQQVNELYLAGIDAAYCVYSTAKGALKHGYKVSIITDGILLRKEKRWDEILKKYKQDGITLITSEEF